MKQKKIGFVLFLMVALLVALSSSCFVEGYGYGDASLDITAQGQMEGDTTTVNITLFADGKMVQDIKLKKENKEKPWNDSDFKVPYALGYKNMESWNKANISLSFWDGTTYQNLKLYDWGMDYNAQAGDYSDSKYRLALRLAGSGFFDSFTSKEEILEILNYQGDDPDYKRIKDNLLTIKWDDVRAFYRACKNRTPGSVVGNVYFGIETASGAVARMKVEDLTFEKLMGMSLETFETTWEAAFQEYEDSAGNINGESASGEIFEIPPEEYKAFSVTESGVYTFVIPGVGPFGDVSMPSPYGNEMATYMCLAGVPKENGEKSEDDKPLGDYIFYNSGTGEVRRDDEYGNCFSLVAGEKYILQNHTYSYEPLKVQIKKVDVSSLTTTGALYEVIDENQDMYAKQSEAEANYNLVKPVYILPRDIQQGSTLEGILADLILDIGRFLRWLMKLFINPNCELTIDNIIFNRLDQTVIDLTPIGGIQINPTGQNVIFANSSVKSAINVLYNALKVLAIVTYIVLLLFIGVRILLAIGTTEQKKYTKYFEYWVTGLILLAIVPYFLPAIPAVANSFISIMESYSKDFSATDRLKEVINYLNDDPTYVSEDADAVVLKKLANEEIKKLRDSMEGSDNPAYRDDAKTQLKTRIEAMAIEEGLDWEQDGIQLQVDQIIAYIDANFDLLNENDSEAVKGYVELKGKLSNFLHIKDTSEIRKMYDDIMRDYANLVMSSGAGAAGGQFMSKIDNVYAYVCNNVLTWNEAQYNKLMDELKNVMNGDLANILDKQKRDDIVARMNTFKETYLNAIGSDSKLQEFETYFQHYRNDIRQKTINEIQDLLEKINNDIMNKLFIDAQEQNRIVYAIAWDILVFQMFAILFLYYRRLFVIIILIIIFPLIMLFYVIDKIIDGTAQSFSKWFNEFLANILVQILHAGIYILIINSAIEICEQNPSRNWLILILAVCFLFPGERLLRGILGLQASTLGELKTHAWQTVIAAKGLYSTARNGYRLAKKGVNTLDDIRKGDFQKKKKQERAKRQQEQENRIKAQEAEAARRARIRQQKRAQVRARLANDNYKGLIGKAGKMKDKVMNTGSNIAGRVANSAPVRMASTAKKTINGIRKSPGYVNAKYAIKSVKAVATRTAKAGVGIAMGAVEGAESFSQEGLASGFITARSTAKSMGGFKDQDEVRLNDSLKNWRSNAKWSKQYQGTSRSNPTRSSGSAAPPYVGTTSGGTGGQIKNSVGASNKTRTTYRYRYQTTTRTKNVNGQNGGSTGNSSSGNTGHS